MNSSRKFSSFPVFLIQFIINLLSVLYVNMTLNLHHSFITSAIATLLTFYIPSFIMYYFIYRNKDESSLALSWILPASTMYFLLLPLFRLITINNLIFFISICNIFVVLGNTVLIAAIISALSFAAEKVIKKTGKYVFLTLSIISVFFYILDAALFYYSHFRLNYQTIAWTMTMNDIKQTTLATCLKYLSPLSISIIIVSLVVSVVIYCQSKKILSNKVFKTSFIFVLLASQLSAALLQLSSPIPQLLRDPFFELINSLPLSKYFSKKLSMEEINKGFEECNIPLKKYTEKEVKDINNQKSNVILITLESVHWRYVNMFGEKEARTWPLMSKLKNRMVIFPFIFSCFPESTCGDYAMITSMIPFSHLFINQNPNMVHKGLVNELKKQNYNTYLFSSESLYDGGLINLTKIMPFDYSFSFNSSERVDNKNTWIWGYKEEFTTKSIVDCLKSRDPAKPYFLWYRTVYPHSPFTNLEPDKDMVFKEKNEYGELTLLSKYKNALIYLDKVLYNFINEITELDNKNKQQTLIVMV
ncbi:MAG: sulfatase-like hydrolase/transferase, partial [Candidatus Riflebacteria bacterium]|nr:sulfatase-like hydrolase/transferase [Candidatus Riflebacteria bacterium]